MEAVTIILLIGLLILTGLCIFFIYMAVTVQSQFINPKNCPQQTTEFGVTPLTVGNSILNTCGPTGHDVCTFTNVGSLNDAITLCHLNANVCQMFSYAPGVLTTAGGQQEGIMSIVSTAGGISSSTIYDTYTQQIFANLS